jgi:pyruvate formate lyase activating enzyme
MFQKKLEKGVQCLLCPNNCVIQEEKYGVCGVRKNINGKIKLMTYGIVSSLNVDPIEKKPLYHFFPGKKIFSVGSYGCNLKCGWCQNYGISNERFEYIIENRRFKPEEIIKKCVENNSKFLAFTYNEPIIWFEYIYDICKLAKKEGIKIVLVTNGYINEKPLKKLIEFIDAINVDLKGFNIDFYKEKCFGKLDSVLEALKIYKKKWLEITNLLIPEMNDSSEEIKMMSKWISENLGKDTPLHFSRFYPLYKCSDLEMTSKDSLIKARNIAKKFLDYVYVGNVSNIDLNSTFCPKCNKIVIKRDFYDSENLTKKGKCPFCGFKIAGVF